MHDATQTRGAVPDDLRADVAAYLEGATALLGMPLDAERQDLVGVQLTRLAAFARRLDDVELGDDIEPAGAFVP